MTNASIGQNISKLSAAPESTDPLHIVAVSNHTPHSFLDWVSATIFFKQGEKQVSQLRQFGPKTSMFSWKLKSRWEDGSVKQARIDMPFFLTPNQLTYVPLEEGATALVPHFQIHDSIFTKVRSGFLNAFTVSCKVNGVDAIAAPLMGTAKVLSTSNTHLSIRYRSHFYTGMPATKHALSCTMYVDLFHLSPIIRCTLVIGNDTLEMPVPGGMQITNFQINSDPQFQIFQRQAYGSMNFSLGDAQTMAVKGVLNFSTDQVHVDSALALTKSSFVGFDYYPTIKESKALAVEPLPTSRVVTNQDILTAHAQVNAQVFFPTAETKAHLGHINQNPPSTGDQPDFGSTMPTTLQKATMAYSTKALDRVLLACLRESFRPSFYWETRDSVEDRCNMMNYPTLFFWSGRPHYHPSWNPEYPAFQARGSMQTGPYDGWGGSDNQHLSNTHLRYVTELSNDSYLTDVCKYYVSLDYWNWFTKYLNNTDAERATRLLKDAYAMATMFKGEPDADRLMEKCLVKSQVIKDAVTATLNQYGVPGYAPFDSCDPRVNNALWCQPYPGSTICVAWQTGFHMEAEALFGGDLRYLEHADKYFMPNGERKTYFPLPNPNDFTTGGIAMTWWSGWVILALKHPNHPGAQFILNQVKPLLEQSFQPQQGQFFDDDDRWRAW